MLKVNWRRKKKEQERKAQHLHDDEREREHQQDGEFIQHERGEHVKTCSGTGTHTMNQSSLREPHDNRTDICEKWLRGI